MSESERATTEDKPQEEEPMSTQSLISSLSFPERIEKKRPKTARVTYVG